MDPAAETAHAANIVETRYATNIVETGHALSQHRAEGTPYGKNFEPIVTGQNKIRTT